MFRNSTDKLKYKVHNVIHFPKNKCKRVIITEVLQEPLL